MTDPRDARILELRRAGHSVKTIAAMVRAGKSTVEASLARQGETHVSTFYVSPEEVAVMRALRADGESLRAISRAVGRSPQSIIRAIGLSPKPRPAGWGEKQSVAARAAHREGGAVSPEAAPAFASIPADPIAASLWMRGIRHTGEALHQARLKPVQNLGGASVSSASAPVVRKVQSSGGFRLGLHAPEHEESRT